MHYFGTTVLMVFILTWPRLSFGRGQSNVCDATQTPAEVLYDFQKQLIRQLEAEDFTKDPAEYCDDEMGMRAYAANDLTLEQYIGDKKDHKTHSVYAANGGSFNNAWNLSLFPDRELRLKSLTAGILVSSSERRMPVPQVKQLLKLERCNYIKANKQLEPLQKNQSREIKSEDIARRLGFSFKLAEPYGCYELLGILNTLSCSNAVKTIQRIALTEDSFGGPNAGAEIFPKILDDERYQEGLRKAGLKIIEKAESGNVSGSNLFDDIKHSFAETGASAAEAEEFTWNTIGLISTRGPDISVGINNNGVSKDGHQSALALAAIAQSLPILDHLSAHKGQIYSFPKNVKGSCNTGKSYHFWFSAYLARQAALETGAPEAAAAMSFQLEKSYQLIGRELYGQNSRTMKFSDPHIFKPANQISRADLAYASVGAVYGANQAGNRETKMSVDETITKLIRAGGDGQIGIAKLAGWFAPQLIRKYSSFTETFNANEAFNVNRGQGFPEKVNRSYLEISKGSKPYPNCP